MTEPYVIAAGQSMSDLIEDVSRGIAQGYTPIGGPFSTGHFTFPHPMLAQAMFKQPIATLAPVYPDRIQLQPGDTGAKKKK